MDKYTENKLLESTKKHEGLKLKIYQDTLNVPTIGYGRNLKDRGVSEQEAHIMLLNDLRMAEEAALKHQWFNVLDNVRKTVVVEMIFNLGEAGFSKFKKTIKLIEEGKYKDAAIEMLDSRWSEQVGVRADTLAKRMALGFYEDSKSKHAKTSND